MTKKEKEVDHLFDGLIIENNSDKLDGSAQSRHNWRQLGRTI